MIPDLTNDSVNRSVVQIELARILELHLTGDGNPVQKVYYYQVADFGKNSPVIIVAGGKVHRGSVADDDKDMTSFRLWVHLFVLYENAESNITEKESELQFNYIEKRIADVVRQYTVPTQNSWFTLSHDGDSESGPVLLNELDYRHEAIPLKAQCYDPWMT